MTAVVADTNIFLRFLTKDVPDQAKLVVNRFIQAQEEKIVICLLHITLIEILFHLERWYKLAKPDAVNKIILIVSQPWIKVENKNAVLAALSLYRQHNIDLVDLLTWTLSQETKRKILSFDKHYDQLNPKLRLEP